MRQQQFDTATPDQVLIENALSGNKHALEQLVKNHQDYVFNTALAFTGDTDEAADITQEVLIKVITKLSLFKQQSNFKTWLYRIVKNHFLNTKRSQSNNNELTFDIFGQGLDQTPDESLDLNSYEVENKLLVEEAKLSCMKGMLLCLDKEQRFIYIIGELFEYGDKIGSEIMDISPANFRVKLHRAKQQLYTFMDNKCGLIHTKNPCRCARKTAGFIKKGYVDPKRLQFQKNRITTINKVAKDKVEQLNTEVTNTYQRIYQEHPFLESPDKLISLKQLLSSEAVKNTFDLN